MEFKDLWLGLMCPALGDWHRGLFRISHGLYHLGSYLVRWRLAEAFNWGTLFVRALSVLAASRLWRPVIIGTDICTEWVVSPLLSGVHNRSLSWWAKVTLKILIAWPIVGLQAVVEDYIAIAAGAVRNVVKRCGVLTWNGCLFWCILEVVKCMARTTSLVIAHAM